MTDTPDNTALITEAQRRTRIATRCLFPGFLLFIPLIFSVIYANSALKMWKEIDKNSSSIPRLQGTRIAAICLGVLFLVSFIKDASQPGAGAPSSPQQTVSNAPKPISLGDDDAEHRRHDAHWFRAYIKDIRNLQQMMATISDNPENYTAPDVVNTTQHVATQIKQMQETLRNDYKNTPFPVARSGLQTALGWLNSQKWNFSALLRNQFSAEQDREFQSLIEEELGRALNDLKNEPEY